MHRREIADPTSLTIFRGENVDQQKHKLGCELGFLCGGEI